MEYSRESDDDDFNKYLAYLRNQNYIGLFDSAIRETGNSNTAIVEIQSREIENAKQNSTDQTMILRSSNAIRYTLEKGFAGINANLTDISDQAYDLSNLVGYGFSSVVESNKITHKYLEKIGSLLRVPDKQKERVYHIEEGLKYLQSALKENIDSEFYTDALEEFRKAEAIESKDFFSFYRIGYIHLYSKHLNPKIAEDYFRKAARYYLAEASIGKTSLSRDLVNAGIDFFLEAGNSYLHAAWACYLQKKYSEAAQLAVEAWKAAPNLSKAGFMESKYLVLDKRTEEAERVLEKAILQSPIFYEEVYADFDLRNNDKILNLLDRLAREALNEITSKLNWCFGSLVNESSEALPYLIQVRDSIKTQSFIEVKRAEKMLHEHKKWLVSDFIKNASDYEISKKKQYPPTGHQGSVIDFIKYEKLFFLEIPILDKQYKIKNIKDQISSMQSELFENQKHAEAMTNNLTFGRVAGFAGILVGCVIYGLCQSSDNPDGFLMEAGRFIAICLIILALLFWGFFESNARFANNKLAQHEQAIDRLNDVVYKIEAEVEEMRKNNELVLA